LNKTFSAFDSQFSIGNQNNLNQSFSLYGGGVGQASLISTIEPEILAQSQKIINQVDRETEEMTIMVDASQSLWVLAPLFRNLTTSLKYGSLGDLVELLDIPNIGLGRARQLYRNGYTSLDKLANADCNSLVRKLGTSAYMPKKLAMKILSAARNKVRDRLDISEEKYFEDQKKARFYDFGLNQ